MRDTTLFGLRLTLGGYLAAHGAQKLFGAFGGRGLEASAEGFDRIGLGPGRPIRRGRGRRRPRIARGAVSVRATSRG